MKTFGETDIEWRDELSSGNLHVIVATRGAAWSFLCRALSSEYETVELRPQPTSEAWVWKHDRSKIDCPSCLEVLDGATVTRMERAL